MGRPAKAVNTMSKHLTKDEREKRLQAENKMKCSSDKLKPPAYLSVSQKKIFRYIVDELKESEILGNLDIFILSTCCIAIDRLQNIEISINNCNDNLTDKALMNAKDKYSKDLYRCCNELSLSPQSRAKIANINTQSKEDDLLLKALTEDDN